MNFSEFTKMLGADPGNQDSEFLRARDSSPEFRQAAADSDTFEQRLTRALSVSEPLGLVQDLLTIKQTKPVRSNSWRNYAMAASVLLAVAVTGITWRANSMPKTLEEYVAYHYSHDGQRLIAKGEGQLADNVATVLSKLQVAMTPETTSHVGLIKFCPTPSGKGAHIVLNTAQGPITVIFMPDTPVTDGEMMAFDGMQAQLVHLGDHSAVIIGTDSQQVAGFHEMVQNSFTTLST